MSRYQAWVVIGFLALILVSVADKDDLSAIGRWGFGIYGFMAISFGTIGSLRDDR